jgi:hypothetical protein
MNLKEAFAGIKEAQEPERLSTQAPERPGTQAPKHLSAQAPEHLSAEAPRHLSTQAPKRLGTQAPKHPLPLQKTGKSSHPEYEPVKIYIRRQTRKDAWRKWEDANGGDFSDLMQQLLEQYLST